MEKNKLVINAVMIAAIYLLFARPILKIFKRPGNQNYLEESSNPNSAFAGNFWMKYFYIAGMTPGGKRLLPLIIYERCANAAKKIDDAFSTFSDDEKQFFAALNTLKTKVEVSLTAAILEQKYNVTLLSLMQYGRGRLPQNGLSDNELNIATNYVRNLPNL
jgi:hypothetical protein